MLNSGWIRLLIVYPLRNFQIHQLPSILRTKQIASDAEQIVNTLVLENSISIEKLQQEHAELERKQEEERKANKQVELLQKHKEERIAKEQAELKQKQEEKRKAKKQAELKQKQEEERKANKQVELKQKQKEERKAKEQTKLKQKQEKVKNKQASNSQYKIELNNWVTKKLECQSCSTVSNIVIIRNRVIFLLFFLFLVVSIVRQSVAGEISVLEIFTVEHLFLLLFTISFFPSFLSYLINGIIFLFQKKKCPKCSKKITFEIWQ